MNTELNSEKTIFHIIRAPKMKRPHYFVFDDRLHTTDSWKMYNVQYWRFIWVGFKYINVYLIKLHASKF